MADESNEPTGKDNSTRLRTVVATLATIYVMTFIGGFLQDTPYNFLNYLLFALLFIVGIVLISMTVRSKQASLAKGFSLLTGTSATLLLAFYTGYEWYRLSGNRNLEIAAEAILYWITLLFWIGAIGSLISIRRRP